MAFNPSVSWFISFREHDPSTNDQCIYFTKKGPRCSWNCEKRDNQKAINLYEIICDLPAEAVSVELIKDYILHNCCRSGRAQHRDRIEDVGLWIPLAERWLDEIYRHATEQQHSRIASSSPSESVILPGAVTIPATPIPSHATTAYSTPTTGSPSSQPSTPISSSTNKTPPTSISSPSEYPNSSPKTPNAILVQPAAISQPLLSEFRAHIAEPGPTDSVLSKFVDKLENRDFETGSLYIFNRDSSPGYVKIGWTANSVEDRLKNWSKCEYTPNLLFSVHGIPHAQRAETLTHYELIKEWRRERKCKAEHCRKSHQEWFEVREERAKEVLGGWAKFMKIVKPYDSEGQLKAQWKDFVTRTAKNGETVTAKKLLEHHELPLSQDATPLQESINSVRALKIREQNNHGNTLKREELDSPTKASTPQGSPRIEQPESSEETLLLKDNASPELLRKTSVPFLSNILSKTEPFLKTEPLHEDVPAKSTLVNKELSQAQIPQPPSPTIRHIDPQDALSIQVSDLDPSPDLLNSSATSNSKPGARSTSGLSTSLIQETPRGQKELITSTSIKRSQHDEESGQAKPKSELAISDGQAPEIEIKVGIEV
ncbi:T5orf172 domain-containing protein [Xylariaceae sp. FL1651]|nr:T5orf172 domain-containing protein [Xylariaceae sp. FL1651]